LLRNQTNRVHSQTNQGRVSSLGLCLLGLVTDDMRQRRLGDFAREVRDVIGRKTLRELVIGERVAVKQPAAAGAETDRAATANMAIAAAHIAAAHGAPPRPTAPSQSAAGRRQGDYRNRSFARSASTCRRCNQQGRTRSVRALRPGSCHASEVTREHRAWLFTRLNKLV
jgi:hypothetical protein